MTKVMSDRILNTNKGDYTPGNYPKFFDLGNKIAAMHTMMDSLQRYGFYTGQENIKEKTDPAVDEVMEKLEEITKTEG